MEWRQQREHEVKVMGKWVDDDQARMEIRVSMLSSYDTSPK